MAKKIIAWGLKSKRTGKLRNAAYPTRSSVWALEWFLKKHYDYVRVEIKEIDRKK